MQDIRRLQHSFHTSLRRRHFDLTNPQLLQRQRFIINNDPLYHTNLPTQWQQLVYKLLSSHSLSDSLLILRSMKLHSRNQIVCKMQQKWELWEKMGEFLGEEYDEEGEGKEMQGLVVWVLCHLVHSKETRKELGECRSVVEGLMRRVGAEGESAEVKDNCLWTINHIIRECPSVKQYLLHSPIISYLVSYFKQDPGDSEIIQSLRTILYLVANLDTHLQPTLPPYSHFSPLTRFLLEFLSLPTPSILHFSVSCLAFMTQLQDSSILLITLSKSQFLKKINQIVIYCSVVDNEMTSIFLVAWCKILRVYVGNEGYYEELMKIDVVRTIRIMLDIEGVNDFIRYSVFELIEDMIEDSMFVKKILNDQLISRIIQFNLESQGAIHIHSLRSLVGLVLAMEVGQTEEYSKRDLEKVRGMMERDFESLGKEGGVGQIGKLMKLVDIALTHIERLLEMEVGEEEKGKKITLMNQQWRNGG